MTPESELRARVERGATFLDQAEPRWWKRVERQLVLADCYRCVLGQMYGIYSSGVDALFGGTSHMERRDWAQQHGFWASSECDYAVLDRLWLEAIEARRADPDRYVP